MPLVLLALFLLTISAPAQQPARRDLCAAREPGASIAAVVVTALRQPRDTVVTATVCVVPARAGAATIGSYHGELHFDSTAVRVLRVQKPDGGVRVENTTLEGQVNFAGAAPNGFPGRALVTVVLRVRSVGADPRLRLEMKELNATDGTSLMRQLGAVRTPR